MNKARVFFKISDLVMHLPRNGAKFPDVTKIKNFVFDDKIGNAGKADFYFVKGKDKYPVIVNVHGGGFVRGGKQYRSAICSKFARQGFFVYNVNYRLSPAFPLPYACLDVTKSLSMLPSLADKYNLDLDNVIITGDSAGAFYACSATLACTSEEYRKLLGVEKPPITPTAFIGFCGAYRLGDILRQKTPLNIGVDIATALMGVKKAKDLKIENCERFVYSDLLKYVDGNFPQSFLVYSDHDDFCGGQTELLKAELEKNNVPTYEFHATGEKDIHCFHLILAHENTPNCLNKVYEFMSKFSNN